MKITFYGAVGAVTGSCFLIETSTTRFLVDCGMFQGCKALKEKNYGPFPFSPDSVDFVLVTHAHIDHTGLLPKLVKKGFKGPIFGTAPTVDLLQFMLPDSARIQESEVLQKNRRNERKGVGEIQPIYTVDDAAKTLTLLRGVKEGQEIEPGKGVKAVFRNAGHLLGSAFVELSVQDAGTAKRIVFGGDLGGRDHPIVNDPEIARETDVLLVESTYGNRLRPPDGKKERLKKLAEVVRKFKSKGGNLIIPAFAVERTQDLIHDLLVLMGEKQIPESEIVIDSPLAIHATQVFAKYPELFDEDAKALARSHGSLFEYPGLKYTISAEESMQLNGKSGLIIMSSSGMCDAGRIKHHLKHNLWNPKNIILFVGYQAEGTLGRLLLEGAKSVRIHGEEIAVEAGIEEISGYSGHADQKELLEWVAAIPSIRDQVFVVHGEDDARDEFARKVRDARKVPVWVPKFGESFDLLKAVEAPVAPVVPAAAAVAQAPKGDSYNLFAEFMLQVSQFMRTQGSEAVRRQKMEQLKKILEA